MKLHHRDELSKAKIGGSLARKPTLFLLQMNGKLTIREKENNGGDRLKDT